MTIFAQCNKVFRFVSAAVTYKLNMMNIKVSVVYRYVNAVFIFKGVKLSAVLTSKVITVKYSQRITVTPSVPYSHIIE